MTKLTLPTIEVKKLALLRNVVECVKNNDDAFLVHTISGQMQDEFATMHIFDGSTHYKLTQNALVVRAFDLLGDCVWSANHKDRVASIAARLMERVEDTAVREALSVLSEVCCCERLLFEDLEQSVAALVRNNYFLKGFFNGGFWQADARERAGTPCQAPCGARRVGRVGLVA